MWLALCSPDRLTGSSKIQQIFHRNIFCFCFHGWDWRTVTTAKKQLGMESPPTPPWLLFFGGSEASMVNGCTVRLAGSCQGVTRHQAPALDTKELSEGATITTTTTTTRKVPSNHQLKRIMDDQYQPSKIFQGVTNQCNHYLIRRICNDQQWQYHIKCANVQIVTSHKRQFQ